MIPGIPWKLTWEWTTVVPEDHRMAPFINGHVSQRDEYERPPFRSGTTYRRRVLIWRGRWRLAEAGRDYSHRVNADEAISLTGDEVRGMNWLIVYRRSKGKLLTCRPYPKGNAALAERFRLERAYHGDPDVEIVVLGADSLETLKQTHGRYFAGEWATD